MRTRDQQFLKLQLVRFIIHLNKTGCLAFNRILVRFPTSLTATTSSSAVSDEKKDEMTLNMLQDVILDFAGAVERGDDSKPLTPRLASLLDEHRDLVGRCV